MAYLDPSTVFPDGLVDSALSLLDQSFDIVA